MYVEILTDEDICNIVTKLTEEEWGCNVTINGFDISRSKELTFEAYAVCKYEFSAHVKSAHVKHITAKLEDFSCSVKYYNTQWVFKKNYAEMLVAIIDERGSEMELYREDYMHDYNRDLKRKREVKIKEAKRHLQEAEQEYEENIIK